MPGICVRLRLSVGPATTGRRAMASGTELRLSPDGGCAWAYSSGSDCLRPGKPFPPGDGIRHGAAFMRRRPYPAYLSGPTVCRPGKQLRRWAMASGTELRLCRMARQATDAPPGDGRPLLASGSVRLRLSPGPASNGAAGRWHQAGTELRLCRVAAWHQAGLYPAPADCPAPTVSRPGKQRRRRAMASGTELRLCRVAAAPYPARQPQIAAGRWQGLLKLPVAAGLNIAETFPRKAAGQPAWMRAEAVSGLCPGRCLGPTRRPAGHKSKGWRLRLTAQITAQRNCRCWRPDVPGGAGDAGGDCCLAPLQG